MAAPPPSVLMVTSRIERSMIFCSSAFEVNSPRVKAPIEASDRFWPTLMVCTSPSR